MISVAEQELIESTQAYQMAMVHVQMMLDGMFLCKTDIWDYTHEYYQQKKELLAQQGVEWDVSTKNIMEFQK